MLTEVKGGFARRNLGSVFSREQLDRYGRQIVLPGVGAAGQARLMDSSVLIVGAGGLGSPAALYLAAAGVGRLTIVDDDTVTLSNLQRQVLHDTAAIGTPKTASAAARLKALNPNVEVREVRSRLDAGNAREIVRGHDVVIDGSDSFETRYALNEACYVERVPLVHGALSQFDAQLSVFQAYELESATPCYRCVYPQAPPPEVAPSCAEVGVWGPLTGITGSLMASEALKLLLGMGRPLRGRLLVLNALDVESQEFELVRDPACPVCGDRAPSA